MNTCKDCKWWNAEWARKHNLPSLACANRKLNAEPTHAVTDTATPYVDDSCGKCFLTGPDFGCIHFEPR